MRDVLARRFVVYIRALGTEPLLPADDDCKNYTRRLEEQYVSLKRIAGQGALRALELARASIKELGLRAASTPFPILSPRTRSIPKEDRGPTRAQLKLLKSHPQVVHICPVCRARSGRRKMSWHSYMWAEAERLRAKERGLDLQVYPCPYKQGTWHLGRGKKRHPQPQQQGSSVPL